MGNFIAELTKTITGIVSTAFKPFPDIPPVLLLCEVKNRSGLSAIRIATSVISRLPEIGIPNGVNEDGSENMINRFVMLFADEFVNEIKKNGLVKIAIPPNSLKIVGEGANAGGPVTVISTNPTIIDGNGIPI